MTALANDNNHFAAIEMDGPVTDSPTAPTLTVVPEPAPEPVAVVDEHAEDLARLHADELAAREAGLNVKPPVYTIGRRVNSIGVSNYKAMREDVENMASVRECNELLIDVVAGEERKDLVVDATVLKMLDDGRLSRGNLDADGNLLGLKISDRALVGIGTLITPGGAGYLRQCPPVLRAHNVNYWTPLALQEDVRATGKLMDAWEESNCQGEQPAPVMAPKRVTLRTRIRPNLDRLPKAKK